MRWRRTGVATFLGLVGALTLAWLAPEPARPIAGHDLVLYAAGRPPQLTTVDPATGRVQRLTTGTLGHLAPTWRPDGKAIAFMARSHGRASGVCVYDVAGRTARRVSSSPLAVLPSWSRDGLALAFFEQVGPPTLASTPYELVVLRSEGSERRIAVPNPESRPSWSPTGSQVAATSRGRTVPWLSIFELGGGRRVDVFRDASEPTWSPANDEIAFVGWTLRRGVVLPAVQILGSGFRTVARGGRDDVVVQPAWSPDGRYLAYQHVRRPSQGSRIEIVRRDGEAHRVLTNGRHADSAPAWSPDGSRIAFIRFDEGVKTGHVAVVRANGKGLRILRKTHVTWLDVTTLEWRPRP